MVMKQFPLKLIFIPLQMVLMEQLFFQFKIMTLLFFKITIIYIVISYNQKTTVVLYNVLTISSLI